MSSMTRKIQRNIVRNECYRRDGNIKGFRLAWYKYHYGKKTNKDGSVSTRERKGLLNILKKLARKRIKAKKA